MRTCSFGGCGKSVFGTDKKTGLGYCKYHQWCRTDIDKRTLQQKTRDFNSGTIIKVDDMDQWFLDRRIEMKGVCKCGCGGRTTKDSDKYFKYSIAHIFPKALFHSVKTHPDNWIELSWYGGCHDRSHVLDSFSKMECWPEVVGNYLTFAHLIKEKHKYLYLFQQYAEPFL